MLDPAISRRFDEFRAALAEAVRATSLDPARPQAVARALKISRNLSWKIAKVTGLESQAAAMLHLPGEEGLRIFLDALRAAGLTQTRLDLVQTRRRDFWLAVEQHLGDRQTLRGMLESMAARSQTMRLELPRKAAFRALSEIWGLRARVRVNTVIAAPNAKQPERLDSILLGGLVDLTLLRADQSWPLFRPRAYGMDAPPATPAAPNRAPGQSPHGLEVPGVPGLLPEFCRPDTPDLQLRSDNGGDVYELQPAPAGLAGTRTCYFGVRNEAIFPAYATPNHATGEWTTLIGLPVQWLQFDIFVDRRWDWMLNARLLVLAMSPGGLPGNERIRIPLSEVPTPLPLDHSSPVESWSPDVPEYRKIVESSMTKAGWRPADFVALRLRVAFPPMHSVFTLRFDLPAPDTPGMRRLSPDGQ